MSEAAMNSTKTVAKNGIRDSSLDIARGLAVFIMLCQHFTISQYFYRGSLRVRTLTLPSIPIKDIPQPLFLFALGASIEFASKKFIVDKPLRGLFNIFLRSVKLFTVAAEFNYTMSDNRFMTLDESYYKFTILGLLLLTKNPYAGIAGIVISFVKRNYIQVRPAPPSFMLYRLALVYLVLATFRYLCLLANNWLNLAVFRTTALAWLLGIFGQQSVIRKSFCAKKMHCNAYMVESSIRSIMCGVAGLQAASILLNKNMNRRWKVISLILWAVVLERKYKPLQDCAAACSMSSTLLAEHHLEAPRSRDYSFPFAIGHSSLYFFLLALLMLCSVLREIAFPHFHQSLQNVFSKIPNPLASLGRNPMLIFCVHYAIISFQRTTMKKYLGCGREKSRTFRCPDAVHESYMTMYSMVHLFFWIAFTMFLDWKRTYFAV